jgi:PIN domain nuclease of toxin-antitoxin system
MTAVVLDASALLALLLDEPGAARVKAVLDGALMTAVNLAEIVSHYAKLGAIHAEIEALLHPLPIQVIPADAALSYAAGMLWPLTLEPGPVAGRSLLLDPGEAGRGVGTHRGAALAGDRRCGWSHRRTDPLRPEHKTELRLQKRALDA